MLAWNNANTSKNCTLAADIDMAGQTWTPNTGSYGYYTGTFDGAGHTISNLAIESDADYVGFIGYITGGNSAVKDLHITNATVTGTSTANNTYTGGIVGRVGTAGTISGCSFSGTVTGNTSCVGGIAGTLDPIYSSSSTKNNIIACYSSGTVETTSYYAGGIVGNAYSSSGNITACYSTASVSADSYAGGIAGSATNSNVIACYWSNGGDADQGIGTASEYLPDTTVEVTDSDWSSAMSAMNTALNDGGYSYTYRANSGSDSESFPLVLE